MKRMNVRDAAAVIARRIMNDQYTVVNETRAEITKENVQKALAKLRLLPNTPSNQAAARSLETLNTLVIVHGEAHIRQSVQLAKMTPYSLEQVAGMDLHDYIALCKKNNMVPIISDQHT